jgi:hypothetical protein
MKAFARRGFGGDVDVLVRPQIGSRNEEGCGTGANLSLEQTASTYVFVIVKMASEEYD